MPLRKSQALQDALDLTETDMLLDLELEEQQLRIAARRVAANRKLEDVEYWRQKSGWYDDDTSMMDYNSGVYSTNYAIDDDYSDDNSSSSSSGGMGLDSDILHTALTICGALVGMVVLIMLVRAVTRGSARRNSADGDHSTNRSKRGTNRRRSASRTRSKSRTRSRSSRRTKESGDGASAAVEDGNYELMEENKSQGSRHRSRSKGRSRSKSRTRQSSRREEMLV
eukprot:CAMPEP_0198277786 /NCGR_PEP_ID=MMETSP1447-20131203/66037_1 /TAXON_ID=420782 /ORGANISM="Chaetoceros dichaeta, Strain CCMP1751" /LENGTH=224 /DNA_ID=CAMNT_0043972839 /DNA_START=236 /DNA_END=910 /DNA_ORIENTATION=+